LENRVNQDDVSVKAVNSRREDKIEGKSAEACIPPSRRSIQKYPGDKSNHRRTRKGGDFVPRNGAATRVTRGAPKGDCQVFNRLRVKMNFAAVTTGKTLEQFCECSFGTVAAVNEGRDDDEAQVSESSAAVD
jgi:hypothetical protein